MDHKLPRRIGISLGNIGALHDGLGEFASQIGQRIARQAPGGASSTASHSTFTSSPA
jgi:hypothetical protein